MTTSEADAVPGRPLTALELLTDALARLRLTDPADTSSLLLAAWHGFGTAEAAGGLLARDNPEDAVLARNAAPVMQKIAERLGTAPALPYTDQVTEVVDGLTPPGHRPADKGDQIDDPDVESDPTPAGSVRNGILALALELNTVLPRAATLATEPADRLACTQGAALAYELARAWEGRLGSYINDIRRDL